MSHPHSIGDSKPPGLRLNRLQLTLFLVGVPMVFVAAVMALSRTGTVLPERRLVAEIRLSIESWAPPKSDVARLYPCVVLKNPTNEHWRNVAISINKQFYFYPQGEIGPEESLVVPMEHFVTKGGNITFRPASQQVKQLTVFAQVPNGERAVFEQEMTPTTSKELSSR